MEQLHIYFSIISQRTNMFGIVETPQMKKNRLQIYQDSKLQNIQIEFTVTPTL